MRSSQGGFAPIAWALAVAVAVSACGPNTQTPVLVTATSFGSSLWEVMVAFGRGGRADPCNSIGSGAVAKVNGEEIPFLSRGGSYLGGLFDPGVHCNPLLARGPVHASADGLDRIRVTDGSRDVVTADVSFLTADRTVSWAEPADGALHPGMDVALRWSPATDQVTLLDMANAVPGLDFRPDPGATSVLPAGSDTQVQWDGALIRFKTAAWLSESTAPISGTLVLNVSNVTLPVGNVSGDYTTVVAEGGWATWQPMVQYTFSP